MALFDITDAAAVLKAVQEFDALGRNAFLTKYGFGEARQYFLVLNGKRYDSKAVVGAAHGYQFPEKGFLHAADFSGGDATVKTKLEQLGFTVESTPAGPPPVLQPQYTSSTLQVGAVYTREQLRQLFGITDSTLNTGLFQPHGTSSLWIFLTEQKTPDRTPYINRLEGDTLYFQSQTQGRKDNLLINHEEQGLELLVFYRKDKNEYPGAGFRYEGQFRYLSHKGEQPRDFVLRRIQDGVTEEQIEAEQESIFDPNDVQDGRRRALRAIALRRGQQAFRSSLLEAYEGRCAISGCDCTDALEAAHVYPYHGDHTNTPGNGLLLRADLHVLFDLGLISIDPENLTVIIAQSLKTTSYSDLQGRAVGMPKDQAARPSKQALQWHFVKAGL